MKLAIEAGREAYLAGRMPKKLYSAIPSSPAEGLIAAAKPASKNPPSRNRKRRNA
jgi:thiazole synthase